MGTRQTIIGIQIASNYGAHPGACRMPEANTNSCTNTDVLVEHAQLADRGGLDFNALHDGLAPFVDEVLPIVRERGLIGAGDDARTLRERLDVRTRYGVDPRLTGRFKSSSDDIGRTTW
jgi:hypothetical protein